MTSFPSVLSDTEGEIQSVLIRYERNDLSKSIVASIARTLPWAKLYVIPESDFHADIAIGGVLDGSGSRKLFDVPEFLNGVHSRVGFNSAEDLLGWLNSSLPFSERFSNIELQVDENTKVSVALQMLRIPDRLSYCRTLLSIFPKLTYRLQENDKDSWTGSSVFGTIRMTSGNGHRVDGLERQKLADLLNRFSDYSNSTSLNWDIRFSMADQTIHDLRRILVRDSNGNHNPPDPTMNAKLKAWPQDQFVVRRAVGTHSLALMRNALGRRRKDDFREYCRSMIPEDGAWSWRPLDDPLPTQGGNMHVSDNILFIGRNELVNYTNCNSAQEAAINVLRQVFGTEHGKHVVWIGTHDAGSDMWGENPSYQPAYHIDLFFCPLGMTRLPDGSKHLRYIFASPVEDYVLVTDKNQLPECFKTLMDRFKETHDSLVAQLNCIDITHSDIPCSLPIRFREIVPGECHIEQYWSFANGIVNRKGDEIEYLMPDYSDDATPTEVCEASCSARKGVEKAGVTVKPIKGSELIGDTLGSLRCHVKVLARS
ncbi:MAG: hypothetical protein K9J06_01240 [Flavobacteriales bacterium]|nr:hypothetical protein [Flavobacteriales bacterium]